MSWEAANMEVTGENPGQAVLLMSLGSAAQALNLEKTGLPIMYLRALTHEKGE